MASLRTQVHFIFLPCPLHTGLPFQLLPLLVARWQQQPQLSHPMTASKGRKGTISSLGLLLRQKKSLPEAPWNTSLHISLVTSASYSYQLRYVTLSLYLNPPTTASVGPHVGSASGNKEEMVPCPVARWTRSLGA